MPETYSPARPNTRSRLRNSLLTLSLGGAAVLLVTTGSEPHATAQRVPVQGTALEQSSAGSPFPMIEPNLLVQNVPKERLIVSGRSQKREQPNEQCWDGEVDDLNHVTKKREKRALANIAIACEIIVDEPWYKKNPEQQIGCLVELWDRESGWDESALNSSGAGGIPQAMPRSKMKSAGQDWKTNPATQITWGIGYINARYKTPCGALDAHDKQNWY